MAALARMSGAFIEEALVEESEARALFGVSGREGASSEARALFSVSGREGASSGSAGGSPHGSRLRLVLGLYLIDKMLSLSSDAHVGLLRSGPEVATPPSLDLSLEEEAETPLFSALRDLDGRSAVRASAGTGGVYFLSGVGGNRPAVVFKPLDEENLSTGGQGFLKEFAAYVLDAGISGVPETTIATVDMGGARTGSVQAFVADSVDAEDFGPGVFSTEDVHRIGILDVRLLNKDRHSGNIMINQRTGRLTPIDHGSSFPSAFEEGELASVSFEWLQYAQSKEPFSPALLQAIASIDVAQDVAKLDRVGLSAGELLSTWMSTTLLKLGAAEGRTLFEIGSIVQRGGDRSEPSQLERIFQHSLDVASEQGESGFFSAFTKLATELLEA
jgi:hypothetical protein